MAQALTSTFTYEDKNYTAVITQIDGSISIYVPDSSLHRILPGGKFTFNPEQGIKVDTPRLSPAQNLVLSILAAVEAQNETQTGEKSEGRVR